MGHKLARLGGRSGRPTRGESRSERSRSSFVPRSAGVVTAAPVVKKKTKKRSKKK